MSFLDNLNNRFAEKNFDPTKQISAEDLQKILNAIRLAPTSYGLQPFHVYVIKDQATKEKLKSAGYNQPQFTDAEYILVFASRQDVLHRIDQYVETASNGDETAKQALSGYADMMRGALQGLQNDAATAWAQKQAYISLGFALAACAELQIDSCPMEGFSASEFDKILSLPSEQKSAVVLAIGYKKDMPHRPKFRFSQNDLFTSI